MGRDLQGDRLAAAPISEALHHCTGALYQQAAGMEGPTGPDPLALDLGIQHEGTGVVVGAIAELDGVGQGFAGDAQPQPGSLPSPTAALLRRLTAPHRCRGALRTSPEHRRKTAFGGQGRHQISAGGGGDQPQGAIEVALAVAIGTADQREAPKRQGELLQGAIARHRQVSKRASRSGA